MSRGMDWRRNRERHERDRQRRCEINPHAKDRKSRASKTKVFETKDGTRVVALTSRRGARLESWEAAEAASACTTLDRDSDEFKEIAARLATTTDR